MISWLLSSRRWIISAAIIVAILMFLGIYFGVVVPDSGNSVSTGTNNIGFYLEP